MLITYAIYLGKAISCVLHHVVLIFFCAKAVVHAKANEIARSLLQKRIIWNLTSFKVISRFSFRFVLCTVGSGAVRLLAFRF